jgi:hypothetical protein
MRSVWVITLMSVWWNSADSNHCVRFVPLLPFLGESPFSVFQNSCGLTYESGIK